MAERTFVRVSDLFQCGTCYHTSTKGCALGAFACDHGESYRPSMALLPTLTLDDLRPKGRWVCLEPEIGYFACSECDHRILRAKCNYCPGCGARMEELPTEVTPDE